MIWLCRNIIWISEKSDQKYEFRIRSGGPPIFTRNNRRGWCLFLMNVNKKYIYLYLKKSRQLRRKYWDNSNSPSVRYFRQLASAKFVALLLACQSNNESVKKIELFWQKFTSWKILSRNELLKNSKVVTIISGKSALKIHLLIFQVLVNQK